MNAIENQNPPNDPELDALLDLLRETPARDPRAVVSGRAKFISDVDQIFAMGKSKPASWMERLFMVGRLGTNREQAGMKRRMRLSYSVVLVVLVVGVILFSGAGATAYAAQSALPGDALYRIKMSIEQTQVRLAADAARLAELHLEFAEHRLDEISGLIAEGRYGEIESATQEFEYHVQQALIAMKTVAAGDPLRAQELAARVNAALAEYARTLSNMMMNVPESTRASMQRAMITSQNASNLSPVELNENENGNINGNLNENINDDHGNLNGNETENDQSNQNGALINENENENHNGEDNTNLNSNENQNTNDNQENQNDSDDQNSSDDDDQNSNSNLNDQSNENQNDSGDDNDHHDGNDNDNDRDNGGNDNGGDGNDNGGDD